MKSPIPIESLSMSQLDELAYAIRGRKAAMAKSIIPSLRKKIVALIKENGVGIAEVLGDAAATLLASKNDVKGKGENVKSRDADKAPGRAPRPRGYKVAPKFHDPADHSKTWAGRGKPPKWLQAFIDGGRSLEEFRITPLAADSSPS